MRNLSDNLVNSATGPLLYCVWIRVHDDRGDRLVSIWMDSAMTAFQPQPREKACGTATVETSCEGSEEEIHKQ